MAKRTQPALYELIRDRSNPAGPVISGGTRSSATSTLPVAPATLGLAVAVVLAVVLGAYLYGFSMGERAARARFGQQASEEIDRLANANEPPPAASVSPPEAVPQGSGNLVQDAPTSVPPAATPLGDPRVEGLNYFVIAQVPAVSADRMVAFCRERDLDAHAVPDDTGGLRFVIVAPGFAAGDRRSEPVLRLEAKIRSVGLQWKSAARGNRDFSDFYPRKFTAKAG